MAKWTPDTYLDLILDKIALSDIESICNAQPATYFNAVWPDLWIPDTEYIVGDLIHPPTINGFIYECTVTGTSGQTEPGWTTAQDSTFSDNTITWKAHENYTLANEVLDPSDKVISDGDIDGRKINIAEKSGVVTHRGGTVSHTALIESATKTLHFVTEAQTTLSGDNDVESGRTTIFFTFDIVVRDPQ